VKLIQEIGSYAGFAAVVGLAVLSALYFSQARDIRRLRDWAGRAPERDAEARSRVGAAPNAVARPGPPAVAQPAAQQGQAVSAGAAGARPASAAASTAAGRGGIAAPPRPPGGRPSSGATQVLSSSNGAHADGEPWYRRLPARYIALIVAGVIVIGGGAVVGALQLFGNSGGDNNTVTSSSTAGGGGSTGGGGSSKSKAPKAPVIQPRSVSVLVYNGTLTAGLGKAYAAKVRAAGFQEPTIAQNAPGNGMKAESVVFYATGKKAQAQLVRKKLRINNIEPLDDVYGPLAGSADVVVVVGQNAQQ
jgi:hypothetical protein